MQPQVQTPPTNAKTRLTGHAVDCPRGDLKHSGSAHGVNGAGGQGSGLNLQGHLGSSQAGIIPAGEGVRMSRSSRRRRRTVVWVGESVLCMFAAPASVQYPAHLRTPLRCPASNTKEARQKGRAPVGHEQRARVAAVAAEPDLHGGGGGDGCDHPDVQAFGLKQGPLWGVVRCDEKKCARVNGMLRGGGLQQCALGAPCEAMAWGESKGRRACMRKWGSWA